MKQNILFLLVDQWPKNAFGFMGDVIKTPNLDQLAASSMVFENAFTTCPLCSPARGALFTSRWHTQTGLMDNMGVGYSIQEPLKMEEETFVDGAVKSGYHVGYYGKWHLGSNGPIHRGAHGHFDEIEPYQKPYIKGISDYSYNKSETSYRKAAADLSYGHKHFYGNLDISEEEMTPMITAKAGCEFLENYVKKSEDKPFMLTVSVNDPHFPHYLPKSFVEEIGDFQVSLPPNIRDDFEDKPEFHQVPWWPSMDTSRINDEQWLEAIRYAGMHRMFVDKALGKVLKKLKTLGLDENTTIIFTSDHGDMCGAHNRFDKGPYYYDEVWRVPLMIRKKGAKSGKQESPVSLLDVGRTIFELLEYKPKKKLAGRDLLELIGNEETLLNWSPYIYGMYDKYNGMLFHIRAIRDGDFKYVYNPQGIDEFYCLEEDPFELKNLLFKNNSEELKRYSEKLATLKDELQKWMIGIDDPILDKSASLPLAGMIEVLDIVGP